MALRLKVPISIHHEDIDYDNPDQQDQQDSGLAPSFNPVESPSSLAPSGNSGNTNPPVSSPSSGSSNIGASRVAGVDVPTSQIDPELYNALKSSIMHPPLRSDPQYQPSTKRKVFASIMGGLAGTASPQAGIETAQSIVGGPYNRAYQDWLTKTQALEKGTQLGVEALRARFSGLTGVGSYIRAVNSGDVGLQGEIAAAKDAAKDPIMVKEYKYYKALPGNEKASFDDFLNARKSTVERISGQMVTADSAQERAAKGEVFKDREGKVIDPNDLKSTEGLVLISGGNARDQRYERVDQTLKEFTAGNVRTLFGSRSGPGTSTVAVGAARVPSVTAREEAAQTPEGEPVAQKLNTTQTPVNSGMTINPPDINKRPGSQIPQVAPPAPVQQNNNIQQPQVQSPITGPDLAPNLPQQQPNTQNTQVPPVPGNTQQTRPLPAFQPSEVERQRKYAVPIKVAASQLLGDPGTGSKALDSYAHLMDDKESRQRTGTAIRYLLDTFGQSAEKGEAIGAELAGFGAQAQTGGVWSWFKNNTGIARRIEASEVNKVDTAMSTLTPEEREFIDKVFASYGSISGVRSAISGGAYKWSIDSLKREIPAPPNVANSKEYLNKLGSLGQVIVDAVNDAGISKQFLPRKDEYTNLVKSLIKRGQIEEPQKPARKYKVEEVND